MKTGYAIWINMKNRCLNPKRRDYERYGGRGITVCERWRNSFADFWADVSPRPSKIHQLDRIDNDGPYSPDNVRWATPAENSLNTRANVFLEHDGRRMTITEWERVLQIKKGTLKRRIQRGWIASEALTTPIQEDPLYTFNGETYNLSEWARRLNCDLNMLYGRLHKSGMNIEEAFSIPRRKRRSKSR
jgi:hypothetical protein